jgi:hypothetical protein
MESKFKIGQKVWDAVNFPGEEGIVKVIHNNVNFPIQVNVNGIRYLYNNEGKNNSTAIPTLKTEPYTVKFVK